MKIGMEPDPVEDLERELERAVATAAKVQFGGQGDIGEAMAKVHQLSRRRLEWTVQDALLRV